MSSELQVPYWTVDAFAERPFAGNPAAVCLLDRPAPREWMSAVAAEMNLSETAFVVPRAASFELRWFTPTVEVELCGHATLAAAHVLWNHAGAPADRDLAFQTASGELRARRDGDGIVLDFPSEPARELSPSQWPSGLVEALGARPRFVGRSRLDFLCEFENEAVVRELAPDLAALARIDARVVIATAAGSGRFDVVSRCFAPRVGIPEDPVTGAAHCTIGTHWWPRLGKSTLKCWQASRRGGALQVTSMGGRTLMRGRAFTICEGRVRGAWDPVEPD